MLAEIAGKIGLVDFFKVLDIKGNYPISFEEWVAVAEAAARASSRSGLHYSFSESKEASRRLHDALRSSANSFEDWLTLLQKALHENSGPPQKVTGPDGHSWEVTPYQQARFEIVMKLADLANSIEHCKIILEFKASTINITAVIPYTIDTGQTEQVPVERRRRDRSVIGTEMKTVPILEHKEHVHPYVGELDKIHALTLERAVRFADKPADWYYIARRSSRLYELAVQRLADCAQTVEDWSLYVHLTENSFNNKNPGPELAFQKLAELL